MILVTNASTKSIQTYLLALPWYSSTIQLWHPKTSGGIILNCSSVVRVVPLGSAVPHHLALPYRTIRLYCTVIFSSTVPYHLALPCRSIRLYCTVIFSSTVLYHKALPYRTIRVSLYRTIRHFRGMRCNIDESHHNGSTHDRRAFEELLGDFPSNEEMFSPLSTSKILRYKITR